MNNKIKDKKDGVRVKIFVNFNGKTLICRGRKRLLEAIDSEGSISEAAKKLGISYRKAWDLVRRTNDAAGFMVVELKRGGKQGGFAYLTQKGKKMLEMIDNFFSEIEELTDKQTEILIDELKSGINPAV